MRLVLCITTVALLLLASAATAQYPRGVIAEDQTATWCTYCPAAYAGLEVMKNTYDTNEFTAVRYYATSGSYGNSDTDGRIAWHRSAAVREVHHEIADPLDANPLRRAAHHALDPVSRQQAGQTASLGLARHDPVDDGA